MPDPNTDKLWQRARRYISANQAIPARATLESILVRDPGDAAAHAILGSLYAVGDHQRAAAAEILAATRNPPDHPGRLGDLVSALLACGEIIAARRMLALPAISDSQSSQVLMRAGGQRQLLGEYAAALTLVERARDVGAGGREFHFQYAVLLAFNGRMDESRTELEHCIALDPPLGRAYVQLARMGKQTAQSNHLVAIDAALRRVDPASEDRAALEFAHYKELEDLQRYDEAWQALAQGNALMHARLPHDAAREAALFEHVIQRCTPEFLRVDAHPEQVGPQPIFVIGMPRSGTTVLERLLGNHSQVESAGELGAFTRALDWATDHHPRSGMLDDTTLERMAGVDWPTVGRMYLEQTQWRAQGKRFYVDKLPRHWMLAGLIHKALPRAPILNLVRDPMDVCFSNWRAYFGPGPEFAYAYALDSLAAHHRQYRAVMTHWHEAAPGTILDVDYARLVHDPEVVAKEVLDYCGLAYEAGCSDLTRNTAPSATLSMPQVRQAIHARSFEEWRPYATQLAALQEALGER